MDSQQQRYTLSVLVDNEFGVLSRVASLFSSRGYNIESLCVASTIEDGMSRITLVTVGDDKVVDQISKQLKKLIAVREVINLNNMSHVDRELALIKIRAKAEERARVLEIVNVFRAKIVDMGPETMTVEVAGDYGKVQAIQGLLGEFGIVEMARSGKVSLGRGL